MKIINELLQDNYSFKQAESLQIKYQNLLRKDVEKDRVKSDLNKIKTIAGVDISYYKKGHNELGIACSVLWNLKKEKIETYCFSQDIIKFPYEPGFLGFRECKLLAKAILDLPKRPNLIICDGHGKIHPKRFGEAVHLGLALNTPTIGIAKNPYIGYSNWNHIQKIKGNKIPIWLKDPNVYSESVNELLGYQICLNNGSKPVFISEGYKINLEFAVEICLKTTKEHRQPESLYLADCLSRKKVKEITQN